MKASRRSLSELGPEKSKSRNKKNKVVGLGTSMNEPNMAYSFIYCTGLKRRIKINNEVSHVFRTTSFAAFVSFIIFMTFGASKTSLKLCLSTSI